MLPNVATDKLAMLRAAVRQDVLDEIVAELITRNCLEISFSCIERAHRSLRTVNQRHTRTVRASLANTVEITVQKLAATNLEAFLDDLRSILVHAVFCAKAKNVLDCSTTISRRAMLADVLNAPVSKLSMCNHIDASQYLVDTGAL